MMVSPKDPLGEYKAIYLARAVEEEIRKRRIGSGGAVTALLCYMLEEGVVDGVVAVKRVKGLEGVVFVARSKEEVLEAAGSKWTIAPYTARLKATIEEQELKRIAVLGLPCQIQFLGQMKMFPLLETDFSERIKFLISLFCLGTFAHEAFLAYVRSKYGIRADEIGDVKLEGDLLVVKGEKKEAKIPISEAHQYLQTGCLLCSDYTGVLSDISAGISEMHLGYTVLIARSSLAMDLLRSAEEGGYVELEEAPQSVVDEVALKARGKIERATSYALRLL